MTRSGSAAFAALAIMAVLAVGCGTPCEEAAQICANEGRSTAASESAQRAECKGDVEARAICIAEAESCAPAVVEECLAAAGGDEDGES